MRSFFSAFDFRARSCLWRGEWLIKYLVHFTVLHVSLAAILQRLVYLLAHARAFYRRPKAVKTARSGF